MAETDFRILVAERTKAIAFIRNYFEENGELPTAEQVQSARTLSAEDLQKLSFDDAVRTLLFESEGGTVLPVGLEPDVFARIGTGTINPTYDDGLASQYYFFRTAYSGNPISFPISVETSLPAGEYQLFLYKKYFQHKWGDDIYDEGNDTLNEKGKQKVYEAFGLEYGGQVTVTTNLYVSAAQTICGWINELYAAIYPNENIPAVTVDSENMISRIENDSYYQTGQTIVTEDVYYLIWDICPVYISYSINMGQFGTLFRQTFNSFLISSGSTGEMTGYSYDLSCIEGLPSSIQNGRLTVEEFGTSGSDLKFRAQRVLPGYNAVTEFSAASLNGSSITQIVCASNPVFE